jgi:hypothetical protein
MRKSSYLLLAIGLLTPSIAAWFIQREAAQYRAKFGMEAEGMGFFAIVAFAALVAFALFSASAIYAARSYRRLEKPRPVLRKIELTLFCLTPVLVVLFVYFGMLGGPYDPPQQILPP